MPKRDAAPVGAPCWIDLSTADPAGSRAFYGSLFGWTAGEPNEAFGGYFNYLLNGVPVAGCMKNDGDRNAPDVWSVYLATDDIAKVVETTTANGGAVLSPGMEVGDLGTMALITDAGEAAIGAWQPATFTGFGVVDETNAPVWFELHTRDHKKSVAFYREVFGWDTFDVADTDEFRYTTLGAGDDQKAGIMDASGFLPEDVPAHWSVYFGSDDVDATIAMAIELGGSVVDPAQDTPYGRLATITDSTGAVLKLRGDNVD